MLFSGLAASGKQLKWLVAVSLILRTISALTGSIFSLRSDRRSQPPLAMSVLTTPCRAHPPSPLTFTLQRSRPHPLLPAPHRTAPSSDFSDLRTPHHRPS